MEAYLASLASTPHVEVVGCSGDASLQSLLGVVQVLKPDVLALGLRSLSPSAVEDLDQVLDVCPSMALVLLYASPTAEGLRALRALSGRMGSGRAFVPKHTIDTPEQMAQIVRGVADGRVIVDPKTIETMLNTGPYARFLQELSPREREVMGLMASAYRNEDIARRLSLDCRTVERHINNIYSKLPDAVALKHQRVYAVMAYLKATGDLSSSPQDDESGLTQRPTLVFRRN